MSYTCQDWLRDNIRADADGVVDIKDLIQSLARAGRCIVRKADIEALVKIANDHGVGDPDDNDNWGRGEHNDDALMALSNWNKERKDWEP